MCACVVAEREAKDYVVAVSDDCDPDFEYGECLSSERFSHSQGTPEDSLRREIEDWFGESRA